MLDTSICVFYPRGKLDLDSLIREKGRKNFFISEITVVEFRFGAENNNNIQKAHKAVNNFVNGLSIIPIFGSIKRYAKEKVRLRRMGKPINDEFDLLIGVTTMGNNLILVTDNIKHFEHIEAIDIENWGSSKKVGEGLSIDLDNLNRKNLTFLTPLNCVLKAFIFALNDSADALVLLLSK